MQRFIFFAIAALLAALPSYSQPFISSKCKVAPQFNKALTQECKPHTDNQGFRWTTCTPFSEEMPPLVGANQNVEGKSWCAVSGYSRSGRTKNRKSWGVCFPLNDPSNPRVEVPAECFGNRVVATESPTEGAVATEAPTQEDTTGSPTLDTVTTDSPTPGGGVVSGPPTDMPSGSPSAFPTSGTRSPTRQPDCNGQPCSPTRNPTFIKRPTLMPSIVPSLNPTLMPSDGPTKFGETRMPSASPTIAPTLADTPVPTVAVTTDDNNFNPGTGDVVTTSPTGSSASTASAGKLVMGACAGLVGALMF